MQNTKRYNDIFSSFECGVSFFLAVYNIVLLRRISLNKTGKLFTVSCVMVDTLPQNDLFSSELLQVIGRCFGQQRVIR